MEPGVGEKLCRLWAKIATDDDVLTEHPSRRDNQGDGHRNRGGSNYGQSSNHHSGPVHDYPPRHPHMAYPPHPMYNPYGYPAHPMGQHMFRPMPGDARNQIGHPMMHPPRLGLHHGGPFRPSRPWWNVTPSPPPHLTYSHYPHSNSYKHFGSDVSTPQLPDSSNSSTGGPTPNVPISAARSRNAYSQQRARKQQQQLRQKQQQEQENAGNPGEASNSNPSPETSRKENKKVNPVDGQKSAQSVSENVGEIDEGKSASASPTTVPS